MKSVIATCVLASLSLFTSAQQFEGDTIPNSLPTVPGSELAYFRIADPADKAKQLTLVNYWSLNGNGGRLVDTEVRRGVIIVHGLNRDGHTYMSNMLSALAQTTPNDPNVNFKSVQIISPMFSNGNDKNVAYPWTDGLRAGRGSVSNALVWSGSQWSAGGNNQYPWNATTVSSFEVLDQLIQYFDDRTRYPNLRQIVIAGHSLGGQTVNRYAEIGKNLATKSPVTYWIGNPNSWTWMDTTRPLDTASCPTYDTYRDGFTDFAKYPMSYGLSLVDAGRAAIVANYNSKSKAYARGTQDLGDSSTNCAPSVQGNDRSERFFNFIKAFPASCANPAAGQCDTIDYVNAGHDAGAIMASPAGQARLFLDNFYGDGDRAYDFGYPRKQEGDNPHPDPSRNSTIDDADSTIYAGNMTFQGCWTGQARNVRSLPNQAFDSSSATIETCTKACADGGYTIAGLEYGTQCFCGTSLSAYAQQTSNTGCSMPCAGNSTQICGAGNRLSLYANGTPAQFALPGVPETVGDYNSLFCYTGATGGRALTAKGYNDATNMTLESCANFCSGYKYFGVEYASECYCGNSFAEGAVATADVDCSMTCTGNVQQLCGAGNRLTVFQLDGNVPVGPTTTTTTADAATTPATGATPSGPADHCPAADGKVVNGYTVKCSSDSLQGSYTGVEAQTSYTDCMTSCDSQTSQGCTGFVYVGAENGAGRGTCYLKTNPGAFSSSGPNMVAAVRVGSGSSPTTTTTTTSTTTPTTSPDLCPAAEGKVINGYTVKCNSDSSFGSYTNAQAKGSYTDCMASCDAQAGQKCKGFVYVGGENGAGSGTCWLKADVGTWTPAGAGFVAARKVDSNASPATTTTTASDGAATPTGPTDLCPAADGKVVSGYTIKCNSDSSLGAYSNAQAQSSYHDCMTSCNSQSAGQGCKGFVYVGGVGGAGSGTCWLKKEVGTWTPSGNNFVAGSRFSNEPSTTTTTTAAADATPLPPSTSVNCPQNHGDVYTSASGLRFEIQCGVDYPGGDIGSKQVSSFGGCIEACVANSKCVDVSLSGSACYLKGTIGASVSNGGVWGAKLLDIPRPIRRTTTTTTTTTTGLTTTSSTTTSTPDLAATPTTLTTVTTTTTTSATTTTTTAAATVQPKLPDAVSYVGCYAEKGDRTLPTRAYADSNNTPSRCALECRSLGYKYSGTQYSSECFCGNDEPTTALGDCTMACSGDATEKCGGPNLLSISVDSQWKPTFFARENYNTWNTMGCYTDSFPRTLPVDVIPVNGGATNMTVGNCLDACAQAGYGWCGVEYHFECFGGRASPPETRLLVGDPLKQGCNYKCQGNATEACGGPSRIQVFVNNGTLPGNGTVV